MFPVRIRSSLIYPAAFKNTTCKTSIAAHLNFSTATTGSNYYFFKSSTSTNKGANLVISSEEVRCPLSSLSMRTS